MALTKEAFSKSNLPYKIDLIDWSSIDDNFKEIIKRKYQSI